MTETDLSTWLTIADAATVLRCSERTVERLAAAKTLEKRLRPQKGSPDVAVFSPESVAEEAARRRPEPAPFVVGANQAPTRTNGNGTGPTTSAITTIAQLPADDPIRQLAAAFQSFLLSPPSPPVSATVSEKAFLTIKEAAAWTGLSQAYLRRSIDSGTLKAIRDRGWRIRRKDLETL